MPETLADLIAAHKGVRSYGDLAKASGIAASMWQRWGVQADATDSTRPIQVPSIKAIARTLEVPERRVWLAVGATYGLKVTAPSETPLDLALAGHNTQDLTPRQIGLIEGLVGELLHTQARRLDEKGKPVRVLRVARKTTGAEARGTKGRPRTGRGEG